ncbi:hypothetical protein PAXRUDRAFT_835170 [Paxillus rubicundulus Ve08.2h10]|uniref:RING-type domain-containing protein n=1 Tax=Paxillus rubicundulus Ve08.2h10 TaxID=930991 RepID=A0A0D0DGB4_9AGAM|nr:hypothetical protein PAXRUDRAFT_835170 [Paxillus rubicundulus Ve08.2h10]
MESDQLDPANLFFSDIIKGNERIISFTNVVINREKDITAGVLSVLNFTRVAFGLEQSSSLSDTIKSLHTEDTVEKSLAICYDWPDGLQIKVEEVYRVPLFERSLKCVSTKHSRPTPDWFTTVLEDLKTANSSAAIVIIRYPEVVACLRLRNVAGPDVFVIFNPRPTSDLQQGENLTFNTSLSLTVRRLCSILPEKQDPVHGGPNWRTLPGGHCFADTFVPRAISHDAQALEDSLLTSSLVALALQAELFALQRENHTLATQNQRLENTVVKFEEELREEKIKADKAERARSYKPPVKSTGQNAAYAPWSNSYSKLASPSTGKTPWHAVRDSPTSQRTATTREIDSNLEFSRHSSTGTSQGRVFGDSSTSRRATTTHEIDPDLEFARRLQTTFDVEDAELHDQMDQLLRTAQRRYHCGICLDDFPEDDAVRIESCGHDICRGCVRGHVCAKIDERRFPVLCPVCMADHTNDNPGSMTYPLYNFLYTYIDLRCVPRCQHSAFIDRGDLEATNELRCPVSGCDHMWCRKCQQSIDPKGPTHSCDGASELNHLMKERGWKYCPS